MSRYDFFVIVTMQIYGDVELPEIRTVDAHVFSPAPYASRLLSTTIVPKTWNPSVVHLQLAGPLSKDVDWASCYPSVTSLAIRDCPVGVFVNLRRIVLAFPNLRRLEMIMDISGITLLPENTNVFTKLTTFCCNVSFPNAGLLRKLMPDAQQLHIIGPAALEGFIGPVWHPTLIEHVQHVPQCGCVYRY